MKCFGEDLCFEGVHGSFKSWFGGVKWARKVLLDLDAEGESEEDEPPLTAYTRRLKMMHEKGPFDDIQVGHWHYFPHYRFYQ